MQILQQSKTSCEASKPNTFPSLFPKSSKEMVICVMGMKTTKTTRLPNQNKHKGKPNLKSRLWQKKTRTRTWQVQNNNSTRFCYKNETKTEQNLWQKNLPKTNVEQSKGKEKLFLFIPIGHLAQGQFTCGPCSPMCELWMN